MSRDTATIAAEQAVLGALMLSGALVDGVAGDIGPEAFGQAGHAATFAAVLALHSEGSAVDAVTVAERLEQSGRLQDAGGLGYLVELMTGAVSSAAWVASHVKLVLQAHRRRQAQAIGQRLVSLAMVDDEEPTRAAAALAELDTGPAAAGELDIRMAMAETYRLLELAHERKVELPGVTTGFRSLDLTLGGWQAGDLVIIQARPAMGKTALMLAMAKAGAKAGHSCGIVSAEQPAQQLTQRMLSMGSGVALQAIRAGEIDDMGWSALTDSIRVARDLPIRFLDKSSPTLDQVSRQCRRWARDGVKVVFVDYLQRMRCEAQNRREEVSAIARGLKTAARDAGLCVVALAQSVRDVDLRKGNQRPGLADIAESSDCEREADVVISLYRDEAARPDADDRETGTAELIVCKNRHGPTGVAKVAFDAARVRFGELIRGFA